MDGSRLRRAWAWLAYREPKPPAVARVSPMRAVASTMSTEPVTRDDALSAWRAEVERRTRFERELELVDTDPELRCQRDRNLRTADLKTLIGGCDAIIDHLEGLLLAPRATDIPQPWIGGAA